jgi:hypothetical protein
MQSIEENQEIPKGEAAVMPVGEPRKRCRVWNLAADRRQKRKERTRGYRWSRRKSAAASRSVSRRAKVVCRKRKLVGKIRIQESPESRKELAVARRKVPRRVKVEWRKRNSQKRVQGQCGTRNPEWTDVREEMSAGTGMQQWHKEPSQEYRRTK